MHGVAVCHQHDPTARSGLAELLVDQSQHVYAERDPDYQKTALERLDKKQKIVLMCSIGGTIKTGTQPWGDPSNPSRKAQKKFDDPERAFGRESRSLKACHELIKVGLMSAGILCVGL